MDIENGDHLLFLQGLCLKSVSIGMISLNSNKEIVLFNNWVYEHLRTDEKLEGKKFFDVFPELAGSRIDRAIDSAIQQGAASFISHIFNDKSFPFYRYPMAPLENEIMQQNIQLQPLKLESGERFVFIQIQDVSSSVEREQLLKEKVKESKLAADAKSAFISNISHELRTPLMSIIGVSDLLIENSLSEEQRKIVQIGYNAAENLLAIINDVLDISKIEAREFTLDEKEVSLVDTLNKIESLLINSVKNKKLSWSIDIDPQVPERVFTDPQRLSQILINLTQNAIKFTDEGKIEIKVSVIEKKGEDIFLEFSVVDSGIGIKENNQQNIFDRFVRTGDERTKNTQGTGLGLAISRELVEKMHGKIDFESTPGKGSRFYFTIPVKESREPEGSMSLAKEEASPAEIQNNKNFNILIAEDNLDNQYLISRYLSGFPIQIDFATNGQEAFDLFEKGHYDLIMLDIQMPVLDGYGALEKILGKENSQQERVFPPIIAFTAYTSEPEIRKILEVGFDDVITKPVRKSSFRDKVLGILNNLPAQQE